MRAQTWRTYLYGVLLGAAVALEPVSASAQSYPSRPVSLVVPFGPGGGVDVVARALATRLSPVLGQSVVVENVPGANSVIATRRVAEAPADGHTLLLTTDFHAINAAYGDSLPYDSIKDFDFVSQLTASPLMLVASPSANLSTLADVVETAKKNPGELTFGSLGPSSPHFLTFEWWKSMADVDIVDVPYKQAGQVVTDLLGGHVDLSLIVAGNGIRYHNDGKMKALAVTGPERWPTAAEIPTFVELGYPDFAPRNWYVILVPAGTPKPVIEQLNAEIHKVMHESEIVKLLLNAGLQPVTDTPQAAEGLVLAEIDKYRRIIELSGAKREGQ